MAIATLYWVLNYNHLHVKNFTVSIAKGRFVSCHPLLIIVYTHVIFILKPCNNVKVYCQRHISAETLVNGTSFYWKQLMGNNSTIEVVSIISRSHIWSESASFLKDFYFGWAKEKVEKGEVKINEWIKGSEINFNQSLTVKGKYFTFPIVIQLGLIGHLHDQNVGLIIV